MKKIIAIMAAALAVFGMSASARYDTWASNYVKLAVSEGIMQEKEEDGSQNITRSHFCGLIYNVMNKKIGLEPSDDKLYSDTDSREIAALSAIGVIKGKGFGKFCPEDSLTREEAATIIARAADIIGARQAGGEAPVFSDAEEISDWAKGGIDRVARMGIMEGRGDNKFCPKDTYSVSEGIATAVRLYCSTPVKMEGTKKTELMENVYAYQNGVSTWIEADGEIKACTDYYSGYDVCAGILSDGTKVAALSQKQTFSYQSKKIVVTERKYKVYDLSDGGIIHDDDYNTAYKFFNDCLLSYYTSEYDESDPYNLREYSITYFHNAYNLKTNENIKEWYEYDDGESTILSTGDEIRLYRGNEQIKTIRGKLTDPGQNGNEVPVFKTYFEVVTENGKEAYDRNGNLVYSYPDNISYKAYKDKFEFTALEKVYEADTPFDEFTEEFSKSVSAVCSAEKIHILNDGNEVLVLDNSNVRNIMFAEDCGVLVVEDNVDKSTNSSHNDNITFYNISDGTERVRLSEKGEIAAYCGNNIFIYHKKNTKSYDINGYGKTVEIRGFINPYGKLGDYNAENKPKKRMEYYRGAKGLYRCKNFSLVAKGICIDMDSKYIEMSDGDEYILYNHDGKKLLTTDNQLMYYETDGGRKLLHHRLLPSDRDIINKIKVFDYETCKLLIEADGRVVSEKAFTDNGVVFSRLTKLNMKERSESACVVDYDGNVVLEDSELYPVRYNGKLYAIGGVSEEYEGKRKLYRMSDFNVEELLPGDLVSKGGHAWVDIEVTDEQGREWTYGRFCSGTLTCKMPE